MTEFEKAQIDRLKEDTASAEKENERLEARIAELKRQVESLQRIAADLNAQNIQQAQKIARLESGKVQTVYPWEAE